ncbi:MAG: class I SAM-dependent methyltransferase [Symploca sp. SIO3E6]|nr:class I SAM-dependent methyltransferase [Caldora sp. SIO3E6]
MLSQKHKQKCEFGDFQTPDALAHQVVQTLKDLDIQPQSVIEPSCGQGAFIFAAANVFANSTQFIGVDINQAHLDILRSKIIAQNVTVPIKTICTSFFDVDWLNILNNLPEPILILGNPPWVTSAELGRLNSDNLPVKSNFMKINGLDALTGKSNFDISEWMLLQHLQWLQGRTGIVAMLCKTAVARKVLFYAWKHDKFIQQSRIYQIDALKYFKVTVDACLFIIEIGSIKPKACYFFEQLSAQKPSDTINYYDGRVIADLVNYKKWQHLRGADKNYIWRSGIKHDCSKVMELIKIGSVYQNGNGVIVSLEDNYIYPLLKSSDVANGRVSDCRKYVLITQQYIGEETNKIKEQAPKTWRYLQENAAALAKRSSSVYKKRPEFSIFGVGNYTFYPWKVAISGFYKKLSFYAVPRIKNYPVIFDDTVYFIPCSSEEEAHFIADLLNSSIAKMFFNSMIFWGNKRPITIDLLKQLNIQALARELNREDEYIYHIKKH